jgi:hypothetical protein
LAILENLTEQFLFLRSDKEISKFVERSSEESEEEANKFISKN